MNFVPNPARNPKNNRNKERPSAGIFKTKPSGDPVGAIFKIRSSSGSADIRSIQVDGADMEIRSADGLLYLGSSDSSVSSTSPVVFSPGRHTVSATIDGHDTQAWAWAIANSTQPFVWDGRALNMDMSSHLGILNMRRKPLEDVRARRA